MACILPTYSLADFPAHAVASPSGVTAILDRIKPPSFPSRDWDITKFGAMPDGNAKSTNAIQQAIAACSAGGGGRVVIPKGSFLTGAIHLESNVNLHLADGTRAPNA
jgi:polygalacturonase